MKRLGFTLIEVLVALAIIAISVGAAMRATSAAFASSGDIKDRMMARWIGRNELARLQTTQSLPATGKLTGEGTQGNVGFSWDAVVETTPNPNFRRVEIVVRRQEGTHSLVTVPGFVVGNR
ncbi:MAG: type II secretion system minor pseudopilin GspI [Sulfuritalea sp.]|jgi:general secretion pathway protein I|nr:type II secretion system minor pseudopilin GspI [Sulfuritalea sp.]